MKKHLALILTLALLLPMLVVSGQATAKKNGKAPVTADPSNFFVNQKSTQPQQDGTTGQQAQPIARKAVRFAESLPLRDLPAPGPEKNSSIFAPAEVKVEEANPQNGELIKRELSGMKGSIDPVIQSNLIQAGKARMANSPDAPTAMPGPSLTFEGMSSQDNLNASGGSTVMPPDTTGDVGPNHYVQNTNFLFNVYNKATGAQLLPGGRRYSQLFGPLGGVCSTRNDGDPITLYDQFADRWMISQFCTANDPFNHQLIAISKTPDPTGAYYLYDFQMPNIHFPDYPHFGIWHDGYYMTANVFESTSNITFYGAGAYSFDRVRMLAGDPAASMIYIDERFVDPTAGGQLPTDADGFVAPPTSVPQLICEFRDTDFGDPIDGLRCFEFKPNFDNPNLTTFTQLADFPTAPFDGRNPSGRVDVEQPPPATASHNLDSVGGRLMNRLVYRNQGTAAAPDNRWVTNWTVNVSGVPPVSAATYQAGVRWTEFTRSGAGAMSVRDQGTYVNGAISGATGENDWMASAAQDNQGNIAVGFSASSTTLMPAIKWAGRTGAAPTGTLNEGEATMFSSTGVQAATNSRWGDYSSINTDPVDDCAFWYTQEYRLAANNSSAGTFPFLWNTRVGTFKFPTCTTSPRGQLTGTVTDSLGNPVANAIVTTSNGYFRMTNASGQYTIDPMGVDSYTVTAFKRGIGAGPATAPATILNGNITVLNLQLPAAADVVLTGTPTVTEGQFSNGNGHVDPGETGNIVVTLNNPSASVPATGVTATLSVKNPTAGVYIAQPQTRSIGTIAPGASASNAPDPFRFTLAAQTPVATTIEFVLRVDFGGGQSPTFLYFSYFVGINTPAFAVIPSTTLDTTPPALPAGAISATTGTQTGRLSRSGVGSGCGTAKANPGVIAGDTTARQYDAYTYANNTIDILCVTVSINQTGTALYTAAYGAGGFVPASPATNFLGDPGSSTATMTYSFDVPPMSNFTIVVHDVTPPAGIGQSYNGSISAVAYNLPPVRRRADFDVDLKSDVSVWRPSEGNWYYRNSSTGVIQKTFWGAATDKPVPGDYDGDGKTDFAVFRPSESNWYIRNSFDGTGTVKSFGTTGDVPVPGDYDGDGKTDVAVFRPSEGKWYYLGSYANTLSLQAWGTSTDKLVPADYDGDGKTDFATFRPSDGNWYIRRSSGGSTITNWGLSTDVLVPHDYDGDRKADIAVFRPNQGNWYIRNSATNTITVRNWGNSTDVPVPADYDGDNKADIAVWRDTEGNWYILNSTGSPAVTILNLGNPGDRPVSRDYIPTP